MSSPSVADETENRQVVALHHDGGARRAAKWGELPRRGPGCLPCRCLIGACDRTRSAGRCKNRQGAKNAKERQGKILKA